MHWTPLDTFVVILGAALAALGGWLTFAPPRIARGRDWLRALGAVIAVLALIAVAIVVVNAMIPPIT